jgi:predicted nuclease of predicted toxin-antitoxin system
VGHEVEWVGDWSADPGDDEILAHAAQNAQVLVTLDKDFGELAVALGARHTGIIRLVDFRYLEQAPVCARVIGQHEGDLVRGAIVTVERGRIRVRLPDAGSETR